MLKTLFEQGITFEEFLKLEDGKYENDIKVLSNIDNMNIDLKKEIKNIDRNIKILVFGEIWCPDCVLNISAIKKMNLVNDKFEISIVERLGNEKTMLIYGDKDKAYIPTFVILDEEYNVLGNFIERPLLIKDLENETDQVKRILMMKKYRKGQYLDETIKDILKLV